MMRTNRDWKTIVKGTIRAEMARRYLSYADLADRLAAIGVTESARNLNNKINRGSFTAVFFFQCMDAIGCHTFHLNGD